MLEFQTFFYIKIINIENIVYNKSVISVQLHLKYEKKIVTAVE